MAPGGWGWQEVLRHRILPAFFIGLTVALLVYLFNSLELALAFASFGSSAFIIYSAPRSKSARVADIIPAYLLSAAAGFSASLLLPAVPVAIVAGIALFVSAFLMLAFDKHHAPACGIALAFVLFRLSSLAIAEVLAGGALMIVLSRLTALAVKEGHSIEVSLSKIFE